MNWITDLKYWRELIRVDVVTGMFGIMVAFMVVIWKKNIL